MLIKAADRRAFLIPFVHSYSNLTLYYLPCDHNLILCTLLFIMRFMIFWVLSGLG